MKTLDGSLAMKVTPRAAWLALASLLLCACAGFTPRCEEDPFRRGLWPVYTGDSEEWAGVRESRSLGPFLHWEKSDGQRFFEARPLYSSIRAENLKRRDWLYPLAARREMPDRDQSWLLLLARSRSDHEHETKQRLFGFVYDGHTAGGEKYGGLFPLGGRFLERFGWDKIQFWLWPIFARGQKGGYTETQILWPFFAYGSGDGRKLFRFWPLFGVRQQEGVYDRRFYLWPFIHHRRERLDSAQPRNLFYVLPLYGRLDWGPRASRFYLLPLYLKWWNRNKPDIYRTDLVWPIYTRGRKADGTEFFALRPFYGSSRSDEHDRFSVLLGLVGRERRYSDEFQGQAWRLWWISRLSRSSEKGIGDTRHIDLWPFYRLLDVREADGSSYGFVRLPYLLPMRGLHPDGWDRHYNKLFELYGSRWRNGEYRSSTLFGLRDSRRRSNVVWESWGGLVHVCRVPGS